MARTSRRTTGMNSRRNRITRSGLSRNIRRFRRNMRGTVVRVHNKRPIPLQRDPLPLSFGSGGMSTTFRIVRPVSFTIFADSLTDVSLNRLHVIGSQDEITGTEIFEGYINLAKHFEEYRINSARASLTTFAGFDSKSQVAMALVPYSYDDWTPVPNDVPSFYKVLNQGVFVLKHAQKESVASWLPTQADDFNYLDLTADGKSGTSLFKIMLAGCLVPSDFPIISTAVVTPGNKVRISYFLGHVVLDVNMIVRGRNMNNVNVSLSNQEPKYGHPINTVYIGTLQRTSDDKVRNEISPVSSGN